MAYCSFITLTASRDNGQRNGQKACQQLGTHQKADAEPQQYGALYQTKGAEYHALLHGEIGDDPYCAPDHQNCADTAADDGGGLAGKDHHEDTQRDQSQIDEDQFPTDGAHFVTHCADQIFFSFHRDHSFFSYLITIQIGINVKL